MGISVFMAHHVRFLFAFVMMPTSMALKKTFLILDGNALLHRAWHAIPPLTTKDGRVVNAAYGFTNIVEKMLTMFKPDYMAVAWDLAGPTFRHEEYKEYKATREKKSQELYDQIPIIQDILRAYGIPSLSVKGYEGDDILGTIASMNEKVGRKTLIVTGDLDALQLVNDGITEVVVFVKGLSEVKTYDEKAVVDRYGLRPDQLIDLKTMLGDTSDNIPGLPGIGEKTATILLQEHGNLKNIFAALAKGEVPEKFAKKLEGKQELALQMERLVTVVRNVDLGDFDMERAEMHAPDPLKILPILRDLEFKNIIKKYETSSQEVQETKAVVATKKAKAGALSSLDALSGPTLSFAVQAKAEDLFGSSVAAIGVSDGERTFVAEHPDMMTLTAVVTKLAAAGQVVAHDYKHSLHSLAAAEVDVSSIVRKSLFDTMVGAYLLSSGDREFGFEDIVRNELGTSAKTTAEHLAVLFPLAQRLQERLKSEGMATLSEDIEMPLIGVLFQMERYGIMVDTDKLHELSALFEGRVQTLTKEICRLAGKEFNVNAPGQLATVLFEDLQLPTKGIKKTKSGFSTAAPELEKIADAHAIVPLISEYREVAKLKSTYADTLPLLVAKDGRIHCRFNQCVAATGRLSSSDPNMQNIPIRTELGREIRKAFIAPKGRVLISADYSQIELRLAAAIAKDKSFIDAFTDGADIHRRTAAEMWGVPEDQVTKTQRSAAKAINFGILYGIGPRSLARSAGVSFDEARDFIDRYFVAHSGIASYLEETKLRAHADEFVQTLYGRRRYLTEINSGVPQLVAAAERMAINMPIQGTQADIIKLAMQRVADWLAGSALDVQMLLQVHDELVFEASEKDAVEACERIREIMNNVVTLEVPLAVDVAIGQTWGGME